ncbi:MAG: diguanylate cyclase [Phaeospirillum sp.]|nr:diguanylate cyclase [Phaeospirillum sp.]
MLGPDAAPRLLIIDDETGTIRLLTRILQDFGEIFFATSGEDGLAMVRRDQPDLVLLDAEMPGMSGFDVCAAIKCDPAFADLPILFVTAHSDMESETRALDLGAVDFITKPLSPPIVRARVRTHLTLKQRTDLLHRLAAVDGLTGIANRRSFDAALEQEWRRACRAGTPLSLLMIDVDHFKRYNDHYGHQAGDDCLRAVAAALAEIARRPGEVVARYGGEEFAVILPACGLDPARSLAERLREEVAARHLPHAASGTAAEVSVSIGVASLGGDDAVQALIAQADAALYRAKHGGRNRVSV